MLREISERERMEKEIKRKRVRLDLEFGVCVEHDIFAGTLDVLGPAGQPGHRVVVSYFFPAVTSRGLWDKGITVEQFRNPIQ